MTLIGSVHSDSRSAAILAELLDELHPDQLTVEIAPNAVVYRQTHGVLLLRKLEMILVSLNKQDPQQNPSPENHPDVVAIRKLLSLPYEFSVAWTYAAKMGIKLHAIDEVELSLSKLRQVEESLISRQHLKRIVSSPAGEPLNHGQSYDLARQLLSEASVTNRAAFLRGCRGAEGVGPRDMLIAAKIRTLMQVSPRHLVHIGGWVHLLDDPAGETLYSRLGDLKPRRILLDPDQPINP